jgi:membrane-associated protease RseP (regulator of RpoE activity)
MPSSPPASSGSPPPSVMPSGEEPATGTASREAATPRLEWRTNALLFVATAVSCFYTYRYDTQSSAAEAIQFTVAILGILLTHEFGHYIAARIHKVDASLPFFLPMPVISPFGTMGAVIRMRSVVPTRRALLDIGASGPLAGLVVAIPVYAWGVAHSRLVPLEGTGGAELGGGLLVRALDHVFGPHVPEGMDVMLSPAAFAGWAGMFVTMLNLLPLGQLDGGHVAFSLFGPRQNGVARWVHRSMLAFFFVGLVSFTLRDVRAGFGLYHLGRHVNNAVFWLVLFEVMTVLGTLSSPSGPDQLGVSTRVVATVGLALLASALRDTSSVLPWAAWFVGLGVLLAMEIRWGALRPASPLFDHPPTDARRLSTGRAVIAVVTLAFFVVLFMPVPFSL